MKHTLLFPLPSAAMLVSTPVFAGAGHDHGPKYGGIAREVASVTYELVARPNALTLHVSDHGKPVSTQGAKAEVAFMPATKRRSCPLSRPAKTSCLPKVISRWGLECVPQ